MKHKLFILFFIIFSTLLFSQKRTISIDKWLWDNNTSNYIRIDNVTITQDLFILEVWGVFDEATVGDFIKIERKNTNIYPCYLEIPRNYKDVKFWGIGGSFGSDRTLDLQQFDNYVKVRAKTKGIDDNEKPKIVIDYPVIENNFSRTEELFITVEGKVSDNLGILNIKLNDELLAIQNGLFKKRVKLEIGKNSILLQATDINNNISYRDFVIIRDELIIDDSFSDVDFVKKTANTNSNAIAVVFGIEIYRNAPSVSHAVNDADIFREYLIKKFGLLRENIYLRLDEQATKAEFDKVFSKGGWLDKRVREGKTEIYFYYAGHGAPDIKQNKAYLIPYDGDPNYASQTGYEMNRIYSNLADLKAKSVTVFLDACFSGANRESEMLLADARPIFIEVEGPAAHGITVFCASSSKEISSAWPEKKHGLFSYFLMKGLQGEADINNDSKLSLKELGDYIQQNVSETAGFLDREQTPQLITDDENRILINY